MLNKSRIKDTGKGSVTSWYKQFQYIKILIKCDCSSVIPYGSGRLSPWPTQSGQIYIVVMQKH